MKENLVYWQNGCYIIQIKCGKTNVIPLRIKKIGKEYCVCNKGIVVSSNGKIVKADETYAVIADAHLPFINMKAFACMLAQLSYEEKGIIFLGDLLDGRGVNPHILDRGEVPTACVADEYRKLVLFFKEFSNRCEKILLRGNHEDFYNRFARKYPSLFTLFESIEKSIYDNAGVDVHYYDVNAPFIYKDVTFVHGSDKMVGQSGRDVYDKIAKTFNTSTKVMGHTHRPAIFRDVYSVGCLADKNQGYNSVYTSNWKYGMAFVHYYKNVPFVELVNFSAYHDNNDVEECKKRLIHSFVYDEVELPLTLG